MISCNRSVRTFMAKAQPFGLVAALSLDGIIGVEGRLPWVLPRDREHFVNLTKDKVLVIGRKTFAENKTGGSHSPTSHIDHARLCIVVSQSLDMKNNQRICTARSLDDALSMARTNSVDLGVPPQTIDCWVAGGERLYEEALVHRDLERIELTHVRTMLAELSSRETGIGAGEVARFPMDLFLREGKFEMVSCRKDGDCLFSSYMRARRD